MQKKIEIIFKNSLFFQKIFCYKLGNVPHTQPRPIFWHTSNHLIIFSNTHLQAFSSIARIWINFYLQFVTRTWFIPILFSKYTHKKKSGSVRSGLLVGHLPLDTILSSKNLAKTSIIFSAVWAAAPSCWNQAFHSSSSSSAMKSWIIFIQTPFNLHRLFGHSVLFLILYQDYKFSNFLRSWWLLWKIPFLCTAEDTYLSHRSQTKDSHELPIFYKTG